MPFPRSARVIYRLNPLEEVVGQLRFPPILRIDSELPSKFQELLRSEYPLFRQVASGPLNVALPPQLTIQLPIPLFGRVWNFVSADEKWTVALAREFIGLSTNGYQRWEDFKRRMDSLLSHLVSEYSPSFFVRIGLRYRNFVLRSRLTLNDVEWSELLKPPILGELAASEISSEIQQVSSEVLISLGEVNANVQIRHGLVMLPGTKETGYMIDSDFFSDDRREISDASGVLDYFNREAGCLFHWCITDRLHDALEPTPVA